MSEKEFICDRKNIFFNDWLADKALFDKEVDEEREFLEVRLKGLLEKKEKRWRRLFDELQDIGLIDRKLDFEHASLSVNITKGQLFVEEYDGDPISKFKEMFLRHT